MIVGINKPKGPTSHDIIDQVRRITHEKRVGHAGTLDPQASGVLVVAITRESTKHLSEIVEHDKEYVAAIRLDGMSTTDDAEGIVSSVECRVLSRNEIEEKLSQFIGNIKQIPPAYSAIKVNGQKSYDLARRGKAIELGARDVVIHSIEVVSYSWPELIITVHCGKGVYIRSIAHDMGGYLTALKRTRVGDYRIEDSYTMDAFGKFWHDSHTDSGS